MGKYHEKRLISVEGDNVLVTSVDRNLSIGFIEEDGFIFTGFARAKKKGTGSFTKLLKRIERTV